MRNSARTRLPTLVLRRKLASSRSPRSQLQRRSRGLNDERGPNPELERSGTSGGPTGWAGQPPRAVPGPSGIAQSRRNPEKQPSIKVRGKLRHLQGKSGPDFCVLGRFPQANPIGRHRAENPQCRQPGAHPCNGGLKQLEPKPLCDRFRRYSENSMQSLRRSWIGVRPLGGRQIRAGGGHRERLMVAC